MIVRVVTTALLAGGFGLAGTPAAQAAPEPVSLVVGLKSGGARTVVAGLDREVDVLGSTALTGAVSVEVPAGEASEAAAALRADPAVAYVEPDHVARMAVITPKDPYYGSQWGVTKTGVNQAWETTRGSSGTVVAVVDTGVSATPDLAGRLLPGHDFVNNDDDASDDQGHGTMAAGVIAAAGNNTTGVAGICWTCRILPVKVLGADGFGDYSAIAEGIRWAADHGADIINLSLGGGSASQLFTDAVNYATDKGALVIAAAGNDGVGTPHYPAAVPAALAVAGSDPGDKRYSWSNYGSSWVDIAAPGCNPAQTRTGAVGQFCGTSSATPFVSGVAALLESTSPTPSAAAVRAALTSTADALPGSWAGAGRIDAAAALDIARSMPLTTDVTRPTASFLSPSGNALVRGTASITARATDNVSVTKVELLANGKVVAVDRAAPYAFSWRTTGFSGTVALTLRTTDRGGNVTTTTRRVRVDNRAPAVRVTSGPASGTRHVTKTRVVGAAASDASGIRTMDLLINGKIVQRYAGTSRSFAVQTWKFGSSLTVRIRAYDKAGNVSLTPARKWYR
ncbi:S8 family serine peptidase [Symbioplanes lichenis]|uniref:S8 family serine peptidase n=1 Tax=Symbioplanes lichenis TaxID=1629072 RepID=UPI00273868C9|nr:S8 family serine peptidase [Actinoplanes lichenis]